MFFRFSDFRNEKSHREPVFLEQRLRVEFITIGVVQPCGRIDFDEIRHGALVLGQIQSVAELVIGPNRC